MDLSSINLSSLFLNLVKLSGSPTSCGVNISRDHKAQIMSYYIWIGIKWRHNCYNKQREGCPRPWSPNMNICDREYNLKAQAVNWDSEFRVYFLPLSRLTCLTWDKCPWCLRCPYVQWKLWQKVTLFRIHSQMQLMIQELGPLLSKWVSLLPTMKSRWFIGAKSLYISVMPWSSILKAESWREWISDHCQC